MPLEYINVSMTEEMAKVIYAGMATMHDEGYSAGVQISPKAEDELRRELESCFPGLTDEFKYIPYNKEYTDAEA